MDLHGKVAIVTGATGVIGRGICAVLSREGMWMVAADLKKETCDHFAREIMSPGGSAIGVSVDVSSADSVERMVVTVIDAFGQVDALVNNAGVIAAASLLNHGEDDFERIMDVNVKGAFLCARAVAPHMIGRRSGRIINISSVVSKRPGPMQSAYAASKHAVIGLTQVWCQELGPYNITVNAVGPGFVPSPMWTNHLNPALAPVLGLDALGMEESLARTVMPLGRCQTPEDIGQAVAYFCKADNTSGQALLVDGGLAMW